MRASHGPSSETYNPRPEQRLSTVSGSPLPIRRPDRPEQITTELLELCDEFLCQASASVHTELRQFLAARGQRGGLGGFIDALSFTASARRGAAEFTE
jgi:hypothetical protein